MYAVEVPAFVVDVAKGLLRENLRDCGAVLGLEHLVVLQGKTAAHFLHRLCLFIERLLDHAGVFVAFENR